MNYLKDLRSLRESVLLREMENVHTGTPLSQLRIILRKVMSCGFMFDNKCYNPRYAMRVGEDFHSRVSNLHNRGGGVNTLNIIAREKQNAILSHLYRNYKGNPLAFRNHIVTGNNFYIVATKAII